MSDEDLELARELQAEEVEVLKSIYEGDPAFTTVPTKNGQSFTTAFQYKFGDDGSPKSFILDIHWTDRYPNELPEIKIDAFYNRHLDESVKKAVIDKVTEEAENYIGMSMTYTLFEFVKEHLEDFLKEQPETVGKVANDLDSLSIANNDNSTQTDKQAKPKKDQLTKAQKRKMWDRGGLDNEDRPRGWDWVDVIKHLSQTGSKS